MATTITAPVKQAARSGEYDPAQFPQSEVGSALADIVGVCTTSAGSINVEIYAAEEGVPDVTVTITATLTAYTTAGKLKYIPQRAGMYTVKVTDVAAGESATTQIEVFAAEGL